LITISKPEELIIKTPYGDIYAKKWSPRGASKNVPIILLHDSLGCIDLWKEFPKALADQLSRTVITYDRLGFGKSGTRQALPNVDFIEDEARTFFPLIKAALSLNNYIIYGHSVGGAMAINIAADDKDCIAVITEAAQAFVEELTLIGINKAKSAFKNPEKITRLEKWHGTKAKWVLNAWTEVWLSAEFANWSLASYIKQVTCPTLVLHGAQDEYGSRAFPEFIAKNVSGPSDMQILQNCRHVPHKEKPQEVIENVTSFLSTLDS